MAFMLWSNFILLVCLAIVFSILGFIIYGSIVGFENTLKEFENQELQCDIDEELNS